MVGSNVVGKRSLQSYNESDSSREVAESVEELVWMQCARLLLTLPLDELDDLLHYLNKIFTNILSNPGDEKYSLLKSTNAHVQQHLFAHNGGVELLQAVGFAWTIFAYPDGSDCKVLRLPIAYAQNPAPFVQQVQACVRWLQSTADTCRQLYTAKHHAWIDDLSHMPLASIPAETVVQVVLPSGAAVVRGGFMLQDRLSDVYAFARSYFQPHMSVASFAAMSLLFFLS
jgi:hypothetical protein